MSVRLAGENNFHRKCGNVPQIGTAHTVAHRGPLIRVDVPVAVSVTLGPASHGFVHGRGLEDK
jgi:hypothetical protein